MCRMRFSDGLGGGDFYLTGTLSYEIKMVRLTIPPHHFSSFTESRLRLRLPCIRQVSSYS